MSIDCTPCDTPWLCSVRSVLTRLASVRDPVLVQGESGVGKDVVARLLHDLGPRSIGPFVDVNCGALTDELFEAEMFGHDAGSFTGAQGPRLGRVRSAAGGTLLLSEIGNLAPGGQEKMLHPLEGRDVFPVGGDRPFRLEARVVAPPGYGDEECAMAPHDFIVDPEVGSQTWVSAKVTSKFEGAVQEITVNVADLKAKAHLEVIGGAQP